MKYSTEDYQRMIQLECEKIRGQTKAVEIAAHKVKETAQHSDLLFLALINFKTKVDMLDTIRRMMFVWLEEAYQI